MKHKHSEVIKAFVDGVECEYWSSNFNKWVDITELTTFNLDLVEKVRIKTEPKPDVIRYANVCDSNHMVTYVSLSSPQLDADNNLKLIWDGETGKLKSAEVIK